MIEINTTDTVTLVGSISENIKKPQALYHAIGQYLVGAAKERIKTTKKAPDGQRWAPWAPATLAARTKDGTVGLGLLFHTGTLYNSIEYVMLGNGVGVHTSVPYANYLQGGTPHMPARPFMGLSDKDVLKVVELAQKHIRRGT